MPSGLHRSLQLKLLKLFENSHKYMHLLIRQVFSSLIENLPDPPDLPHST